MNNGSVSSHFQGFPNSAFEFLEELRKNNDREWFAPRKGVYESQLKRPMELLIGEVALACRKRSLPLFPKERSPVTRIYRDTRFHPEKGPFHDFTGGTLTGKGSQGEVYVHVSPESCFVAAGFYMPPPPFLSAARNSIANQPARFLAAVESLGRKRLELLDEWKLRRMPRGFERHATSPVAEYLKLNCFVVRRWLERTEMSSPALVQTVVTFIANSKPLLDWGWRLG